MMKSKNNRAACSTQGQGRTDAVGSAFRGAHSCNRVTRPCESVAVTPSRKMTLDAPLTCSAGRSEPVWLGRSLRAREAGAGDRPELSVHGQQ